MKKVHELAHDQSILLCATATKTPICYSILAKIPTPYNTPKSKKRNHDHINGQQQKRMQQFLQPSSSIHVRRSVAGLVW